MAQRYECLPPVIHGSVNSLILGTFPGVESLASQSYYGNKRNHFWDFLYRCLDRDWPPYQPVGNIPKEEKYAFVLSHNTGLWDMIASCEREGGNDAKIKKPVFNEVTRFLDEYPTITRVICNGQKVKAFWRQAGQTTPSGIEVMVVDSTSTLNPNNTFHSLERWRQCLYPAK